MTTGGKLNTAQRFSKPPRLSPTPYGLSQEADASKKEPRSGGRGRLSFMGRCLSITSFFCTNENNNLDKWHGDLSWFTNMFLCLTNPHLFGSCVVNRNQNGWPSMHIIYIYIDTDERTGKWMIFGDVVDSGCVISCNYFEFGKLTIVRYRACIYIYVWVNYSDLTVIYLWPHWNHD